MKQIIFIQHALDRQKERAKIAQKLINGRLLRIVYDEEEESIVVISAYSTSKVGKYLRK